MNREVKINPLFPSKKNNHQPKTSVKQDSRFNSENSQPRSSEERTIPAVKKVRHPQTKPLKKSSVPKRRKLGQTKKQRQLNLSPKINIPTPVAFLSRLTILTVGISTILGSAISITNSFNTNLTVKEPTSSITQTITETKLSQLKNRFSLISVGQKIVPLQKQLQTLTDKYPQLKAGILIADIESKDYVNLAGTDTFAAASTIKIPILVAFFQDVEAGKINLNQPLTITKESIAEGSGYMQYQPIGTKFSALKIASSMITVSDNTATNILIEHLGGKKALNQRFADWGLTTTQISDRLPDKQGTNTTSPEDLSNLLLKIDRGELVSLTSRDRILAIMKQTERNTLLPQGLGNGATIAHKTGTLLSILGDTGIIYTPNGKRYIASVLVKRPDNDPQAESLIQEISRTAYQHFKQKSPQFTEAFQKPRPFLAE